MAPWHMETKTKTCVCLAVFNLSQAKERASRKTPTPLTNGPNNRRKRVGAEEAGLIAGAPGPLVRLGAKCSDPLSHMGQKYVPKMESW